MKRIRKTADGDNKILKCVYIEIVMNWLHNWRLRSIFQKWKKFAINLNITFNVKSENEIFKSLYH